MSSNPEIEELKAQIAALQEEVRLLRGGARSEGPVSRKGLLLGAAGAALAAGGLLSPTPTFAGTDGDVVLGSDNPASSTTSITGSVLSTPTLRVSNYVGPPYDDYSDALQAYTYGAGFSAVYGRNDTSGGAGVMGYSASGAALYAGGSGILRQDANVPSGPPTHSPTEFEMVRDGQGALWASDAAGAWRRVNSLIPLAAPVRVLDTRNGTGGYNGLQSVGSALTLTLSSGTIGANGTGTPVPIPNSAVGLIGTLRATGETGPGYLVIYPGTGTAPTAANLNFVQNVPISDAITVGLTNNQISIFIGGPAGVQTHVVLDLSAYIQ